LYSALLAVLGTSRVYEGDTWRPTMLWSLLSFVAGFVAALIGGLSCRKLAGTSGTLPLLMGIVLAFGLINVWTSATTKPGEAKRPAEVTPQMAAENSVTPVWVSVGHVLVGLAGVWISGRISLPGQKTAG
jgi:hypothetical protein